MRYRLRLLTLRRERLYDRYDQQLPAISLIPAGLSTAKDAMGDV